MSLLKKIAAGASTAAAAIGAFVLFQSDPLLEGDSGNPTDDGFEIALAVQPNDAEGWQEIDRVLHLAFCSDVDAGGCPDNAENSLVQDVTLEGEVYKAAQWTLSPSQLETIVQNLQKVGTIKGYRSRAAFRAAME